MLKGIMILIILGIAAMWFSFILDRVEYKVLLDIPLEFRAKTIMGDSNE